MGNQEVIVVEMTVEMTVIARKRKELLLTLRDMIASIRTQEGCVSCSACLSMENSKTINLNTCWDTHKCMDGHRSSKLFSALLGAIRLLCQSYQISIKEVLSPNGLNHVQH